MPNGGRAARLCLSCCCSWRPRLCRYASARARQGQGPSQSCCSICCLPAVPGAVRGLQGARGGAGGGSARAAGCRGARCVCWTVAPAGWRLLAGPCCCLCSAPCACMRRRQRRACSGATLEHSSQHFPAMCRSRFPRHHTCVPWTLPCAAAAAAVGLGGLGRQQSTGAIGQPLSPTVGRTTSRGRRCGGSACGRPAGMHPLAACFRCAACQGSRLCACCQHSCCRFCPLTHPPTHIATPHFLCGCSGDYIRSDWEEKQAIATLQAIELVKRCCEVRGKAGTARCLLRGSGQGGAMKQCGRLAAPCLVAPAPAPASNGMPLHPPSPRTRCATPRPLPAPLQLPPMEILPPRVARWEAYEDRNRLIRWAKAARLAVLGGPRADCWPV